jgi:PEP-CTERM motif-containing protein
MRTTTARPRLAIAAMAIAGGLGGALIAGPAQATVIFTLGNNPQPNEENILFQGPETGTTIQGATSQTNIAAFFSSLTGQNLLQTAQGQADIFQNVANPSQNSALTSMDFNLTGANTTAGTGVSNPKFAFNDFIMNPLNGSGTATVTAFDNFGQSFQYNLGNGQNFLTLSTSGGEFITDVQLMVSGGSFIEFKQPRVSGVCTIGANNSCAIIPTPEPGTLALLGAGLLGLGLVRRSRRKA